LANVIELSDLALSHRAARFEGKDHGHRCPSSSRRTSRAKALNLHRHPYEETFIVQEDAVVLRIDDQIAEARAGQIVVVPAGGSAHRSRVQVRFRYAR
jgi:mannose-6-phosphate isomerase-like protein (cupin superfamily)